MVDVSVFFKEKQILVTRDLGFIKPAICSAPEQNEYRGLFFQRIY